MQLIFTVNIKIFTKLISDSPKNEQIIDEKFLLIGRVGWEAKICASLFFCVSLYVLSEAPTLSFG